MKIAGILFCLFAGFLGLNSAQAMIKEESSNQGQIAPLNSSSSDKQNTQSINLALQNKFGIGLTFDTQLETILDYQCKALEFQHICFDLIQANLCAAKNMLIALENLKQTIENTDLFELNANSINGPVFSTTGQLHYHLKPFTTVEGYYCSYMLKNLAKDYRQFNELKSFAQTYMNTSNEEVKKIAQFSLAKSNFDYHKNEYSRLIKIYQKMHAQEPPVQRLVFDYNIEIQNTIIDTTKIKFYPISLFNYLIGNQKAVQAFHTSNTFQSKIKSLEHLVQSTNTFIVDYTKNKELFSNNYKMLKNKLKNSARSFLKTKYKDYFDNGLDFYSLNQMKYSLPAEDLAFIRSFIKEDTKIIKPSELILLSDENQSTKSKSAKKKKNRRKNNNNQTNLKDIVVTTEKMQPSKITQPALAVALEKLTVEKGKKRKDNTKNIFFLDKKIAKKIIDEKNDMTIHIYRLKDNDFSASNTVIYHDRVNLWFSNPKLALEQKKFAPADPRKINSQAFHSFNPEVDKYALKWGFKRNVRKDNKDITEIVVPGIIDRGNKRYEGLFEYVIDNKCLCYHRFFKECDWRNKLSDEWQVTIDE